MQTCRSMGRDGCAQCFDPGAPSLHILFHFYVSTCLHFVDPGTPALPTCFYMSAFLHFVDPGAPSLHMLLNSYISTFLGQSFGNQQDNLKTSKRDPLEIKGDVFRNTRRILWKSKANSSIQGTLLKNAAEFRTMPLEI